MQGKRPVQLTASRAIDATAARIRQKTDRSCSLELHRPLRYANLLVIRLADAYDAMTGKSNARKLPFVNAC
jgi:hypothetical protein